MKIPVKIRGIQRKDHPALKALLKAQSHFKPQEVKVALELIDMVLNDPGQEDYTIRLAESADGKILGYLCYGKAPMTDAAFDIYWIVVHPDFWNQGIGSALLHLAEEEMKRRQARLLLIETSSLPAYEAPRAFYYKQGYEEEARILDYYAWGDHKLIFRKNLPPGQGS